MILILKSHLIGDAKDEEKSLKLKIIEGNGNG